MDNRHDPKTGRFVKKVVKPEQRVTSGGYDITVGPLGFDDETLNAIDRFVAASETFCLTVKIAIVLLALVAIGAAMAIR